MKKEYTKPEIVFESFSLSVSIAAGCEEKVDNQAVYSCPYESSGNVLTFTDSIDLCDFTPDDGKWNGFCYHHPDGGPNIFNS